MTGTRPRVAASTDELIYGVEAAVPPVTPMAPREPAVAPAPPAPAATAPTAEPDPALVSRVIYTNQLEPELYRELRQYGYWAHMQLHEIFHEALVAYLADKPEARKPLPPKVADRILKRLVRK